jgi:hypothetical protein
MARDAARETIASSRRRERWRSRMLKWSPRVRVVLVVAVVVALALVLGETNLASFLEW